MTPDRLVADLQDAWRQAMADGPRGWGLRGWIYTNRQNGMMSVVFQCSAVAEPGGPIQQHIEGVMVNLDADIENYDVASHVVQTLLERAWEARSIVSAKENWVRTV